MAKVKKNINSKQYGEEWLDNQSSLKGQRRLKKPKSKKSSIEIISNATVIQVHPKLCHVLLDKEQKTILCNYKRSKVYSEIEDDQRRDRSAFAVGDRVFVVNNTIEGLEPRKNKLLRISPERDQKTVQVLAANIDLLFIVCSVSDPGFSPGLVDRFLVAAQSENIPSILLINKWDLINNISTETHNEWEFYKNKLGVECIETSVVSGKGLSKILEVIKNKTVLFCGHSGVGKTSLVNKILKETNEAFDLGKVGDVNTLTKKGKHTTTSALLYPLSENRRIIDTPGIRSFGIHYILESELMHYFPELKNIQCPKECHHLESNLDCKFHSEFRGKSYLKLLAEIRESS